MTTTQLYRTLARNLDLDDPANLSGDEALEVLAAINDGLARFFDEGPAIFGRTTISTIFRAPILANLTFTAQYSNELVGTPFNASWRGCGVRIKGVEPDNEITGVSSVLDGWLDPDLSAEAQILFDTAVIPRTIERIVSDVRIAHNCKTIILKRDTVGVIDGRRELRRMIPGVPLYYRFEPLDVAAGGTATGLIRIHPAPMSDITARFEAEISFTPITFAELVQGAIIPIADQWVPLLVPLCEAALSYSPLWLDKNSKQQTRDRADYTITKRIKLLANDPAAPDHTIGTPRGF